MSSYADIAASGPKQSPEEVRSFSLAKLLLSFPSPHHQNISAEIWGDSSQARYVAPYLQTSHKPTSTQLPPIYHYEKPQTNHTTTHRPPPRNPLRSSPTSP